MNMGLLGRRAANHSTLSYGAAYVGTIVAVALLDGGIADARARVT